MPDRRYTLRSHNSTSLIQQTMTRGPLLPFVQIAPSRSPFESGELHPQNTVAIARIDLPPPLPTMGGRGVAAVSDRGRPPMKQTPQPRSDENGLG